MVVNKHTLKDLEAHLHHTKPQKGKPNGLYYSTVNATLSTTSANLASTRRHSKKIDTTSKI